jgi:hypothetical protein
VTIAVKDVPRPNVRKTLIALNKVTIVNMENAHMTSGLILELGVKRIQTVAMMNYSVKIICAWAVNVP